VLVLWGKEAGTIKGLLTENGLHPHLIESVHPSPLSARRGFFGSKPFSKVNQLLDTHGLQPIDWKA